MVNSQLSIVNGLKINNMRKGLIILYVLMMPLAAGWSQTKSIQKSTPLSEAKPESVGISSERLNRIDAMCKEAIKKREVPGIVALIDRNGKIVFNRAYGMADNETGRKMKNDDIFRFA